MKTSLKINNNGDLVLENGDLVIVDENEDIMQGILTRLSIAKDEWFLDVELGLDYDAIVGQRDTDGMEMLFLDTILDDERIADATIEELNLNHRDRFLTVKGTAYKRDETAIDFEL